MKIRYQLCIFMMCCCLILTNASSQVLETKSLSTERGYEPIEIKMEKSYFKLLHQQGTPTSQLFLYAYYSGTGWVPVPFQIDEKNAFDPPNNVLDSTDVLIFLAKDLGDKVTNGNWIENESAQSNKRYEIEIVDLRDRSKKGWCYLFISSTLTEQDKSDVKYLSVDIEGDKVIGKYYQLDYSRKWYPENISITTEGGGANQDFYDRTKIRFIMLVGGLWATLLEDDLFTHPDSIINYTPNSVVRLQRKIPLELYLFNQPSGRKVNFSMVYYPYSALFSGEIGLDQFIGIARVKTIRMSYDLNSTATGMKFISGDSNGVKNQNKLINGDGFLDNVDTSLVEGDKNWTMVTGTPGTMLTLNNVRYESNPPTVPTEPYDQYLYYWDDLSGGTLPNRNIDPTYDWDTGDSSSFGDHGMAFESYALTDSFHYNSTTYYLKGDVSPNTAQTIFQNFNAPMLRYIREQAYLVNVERTNDDQLPAEFRLRPNFPNPFNPTTNIIFDLPKNDFVALEIFDVRGKHIITLVNENLPAGVHTYLWDGRDKNSNMVSSGVYICTIKTKAYHASQKLVFVK